MKLKPNKPLHGEGEHGHAKRMGGLMAGTHLPQRTNSGYDDRKGYSDNGKERRNGKQTGKLKSESDTRVRKGPEGNAKGSSPPGVGKGTGVRGTLASHGGDSGRGGAGRMGKSDAHKGRATPLSESPNSAWFEKLGSN